MGGHPHPVMVVGGYARDAEDLRLLLRSIGFLETPPPPKDVPKRPKNVPPDKPKKDPTPQAERPPHLKPCGTRAAYEWHIENGERPCPRCREGRRKESELYRRSKGVPAQTKARCGTPSGYKAHRRKKEKACKACSAAHSAYQSARDRRARQEKRERKLQENETASAPLPDTRSEYGRKEPTARRDEASRT